MKKTTVILAVSMAANVALSFVVIKLAASTSRTENPRGPAFATVRPTADLPGTATPAEAAAAWKSLHSPDLATFTANLRAAAMPEALIRTILTAEINARFLAREQALRPARKKQPFWELEETRLPMEVQLAQLDLRREKARLRAEILGPDPIAVDEENPVAPEKREQLRLIEEDYNTMINAVRNHPPLASEAEKLKYLEAEKRREIASLLSPEELADYDMRTSRTTADLRYGLRGLAMTADEFAAIYAAEKPYTDRFKYADRTGWTFQDSQAQKEASLARDAQIRASLGERRYADYLVYRENEFQQVRQLVLQAGLPEQTAREAFELRKAVAGESQRIVNQTERSVEQRQTELAALAAATRAKLTAKLGPEVAPAYLKIAGWLTTLDGGSRVEFHENGWGSSSIPEQVRPEPAK